MSKVILKKIIKRQDLRDNRNALFVFGDNIARDGFGGQAREMRGEPNALGIPTKWIPSNDAVAFFYDFQFSALKPIIDIEFSRLFRYNGDIYWPADGIGTGLADLPNRAPYIHQYIQSQFKALQEQKNIGAFYG